MLTDFFDHYAQNHRPYKDGHWCYEDGVIYRGLELLHKSTGEARWLAHLHRLIAPQLLEGPNLLGYDPNEYNIDHVMAGRALMYLHKVTGEDRYLGNAKLLISQLDTHPRTKSGVYWHKNRYPWQIWLDGLYMGAPFQINFGLRTGQEALVEDALKQVSSALDLTYVPATRLYAHAYDEAQKQPWAQKGTGHTKAHWARAVGWLAMALVDIAALVGPARFAPLKERTTALMKEIMACRQRSGLWLQVMDQPDLAGNWEETSASAMFSYALLRAADLGLAAPVPDNLLRELTTAALRTNAQGQLEMVDICHVAGLGMYQGRFRDGTAKYYISEDRVSNDTKGVGPLMMAYAADFTLRKHRATAIAGQ
jgi:unsaturated rhamnogalacturonyl hydrolase